MFRVSAWDSSYAKSVGLGQCLCLECGPGTVVMFRVKAWDSIVMLNC